MAKGQPLTPERKAELAAARKAARERRNAERLAQSSAPPISAAAEALGEAAPTLGMLDEERVERRQRLLAGLDPDTAALVSDDELEQIEREERERALQERKKQLLADIRASAKQRARVDHDLIPASVLRSEAEQKRLSQKMEARFNLPSDGAGHTGANGFRVDGRLIRSGEWTPMIQAQYDSLLPNFYLAWLNEFRFKTLDQHKPGNSAQEVMGTMIRPPEVRYVA